MLKTILKQSSKYFWGEAAVMAAGVISFPILTRILTKEQYGIMSLLAITATIITTVFSLGTNRSILRFYHAYKKKDRLAAYLNSTLYTMLLSQFTGLLLSTIVIWFLFINGLVDPKLFFLLPVVLGVFITQQLFIFLNTIFRLENAVMRYVSMSVLRQYATMALSVGMVILYGNLFVFFGSQLLVQCFIIGTLIVFFIKNYGFFLDHAILKSMVKESVKYGVPLSLSAISMMIFNSGDRYVIAYFLGADDVAVYSVGFNLCLYFKEIVVTSINLSLLPVAYKLWEDSRIEEVKDTLHSVVKYYFMIGICVLCLYSLIPFELISVVASEKYIAAASILPILMAGIIINFDFPFAAGLHLKRKTISIMIAMATMAVINIILNFILIPRFGIQGAAYATAICGFLLIAFLYSLSRRALSFQMPYKEIGTYIILGGLSFMATEYLAQILQTNNIIARAMTLSLVFFIIYFSFIIILDNNIRNTVKNMVFKKS